MVRSLVSSLFTAILLSVVADGVQADVVTIEVAIKSVDPEGRTITVLRKAKTLELDVSKKAEVTINGKPGVLDALVKGQAATIDYVTDLEIVTKIEASGEGTDSPGPELVVLNELDSEGNESNPWLSFDGLTIYWTVHIPPSTTRWVWTAKRADPDSLFENPSRLIPASDFPR